MNAIKVDERAKATQSELKQLRQAGKIPGVVYGKNRASEAIAVDAKELMRLLRQGGGGVLDMEMPDDQVKPVMITEIQRDTVNGHILHIDFRQVNMEEPVRTKVRLNYIGTPQGVSEGGLQQIQEHEVEISCKPKDIPASIEVDISRLQIGQSVTIGEISPPPGVEILAEPADVLVTILEQQKVDEEPADKGNADPEAYDGVGQRAEKA
ncbi:50S ribosomal protein L25 [Xylanibacillus composti]|uniref:Large ribosomal subunit protein bL25 n=1 Tax=Xylanibacillus composti TaxID=1572762 RepID=A0A8J4H263_9BACL|nr:50S ribosomal protein L25 [Xylanibacillus composti]MDT9725149.1 50S ribosomal protein L25 [Xylanibacillus composti]GIQ67278.1 50S ribosomal protein L25 [Xylanibacillus composti]